MYMPVDSKLKVSDHAQHLAVGTGVPSVLPLVTCTSLDGLVTKNNANTADPRKRHNISALDANKSQLS